MTASDLDQAGPAARSRPAVAVLAVPVVLAHSLLGCLFFGAFTTKMLALRLRSVPGWALPLLGGLLFSALAGLWLTSALWFFTTTGVTR